MVVGLFQQITNTSHLPPVGANAENLSLDIKVKVDCGNYRELAKDVAAFAVLGGSHQDHAEDRKRGIVGKYLPMDQEEAKQARDAFNQATRDLCSPKPVINPVVIGFQEGFIVAINVWPFPGQAVGIQINKEPPGFAFPFRIGVETEWLTAVQLPMLMVPELRRVTILLDAIPTGAQVGVLSSTGPASTFTLVEMRPLENVVVLRAWPASERSKELYLPIDVIRSVWKAHQQWRIVIEGHLYHDGVGYYYQPLARPR